MYHILELISALAALQNMKVYLLSHCKSIFRAVDCVCCARDQFVNIYRAFADYSTIYVGDINRVFIRVNIKCALK